MSRQTEIPGTESPDKDPDIENALDVWLEALESQRRASAEKKLAHDVLLLHLDTSGRDRYAYIDPKTGKKRVVYPKTERKVASAPMPKINRKEADVEVGDEVTADDKAAARAERSASTVEKRRVSRSSVEEEIDPFSKLRQRMTDTEH